MWTQRPSLAGGRIGFFTSENPICRRRVRLAGLPTSRNWVFGKEDIEELIFMLAESGEVGEEVAVRPSR